MLHGLDPVGFLSRGPLGGWRGHSGGVGYPRALHGEHDAQHLHDGEGEGQGVRHGCRGERAPREHAPAQVVKFDRDGTQG